MASIIKGILINISPSSEGGYVEILVKIKEAEVEDEAIDLAYVAK